MFEKFRNKFLSSKPKTEMEKGFANGVAYSRTPMLTQFEVVEKFKTSPFLHLCVDKIAKSTATNEWKLYKTMKSGDSQLVKRHDLLKLIAKPNPFMTGFDFIYTLQAWIDLHGNAYIMYERNSKGKIINLWLVTPSMITQVPTAQNKYSYTVVLNSHVFNVPCTEMIHIKEINVSKPYGDGVGTANGVAKNIQIEENAISQVNQFFYNNMTPEGIIGIEGLNEDELLEFKEKWQSEQQGFLNAYKMHFVNTSDLKYTPTQSSFKDNQVLELTKQQQETIRVAFGISPEVLGIVESSNRATALTARELFITEVIKPRLMRIRDVLNVTLVQEFGTDLRLDYNVTSAQDTERAVKLIELVPSAFTLNEIRVLANLEPKKELENVYGGISDDSTNIGNSKQG